MQLVWWERQFSSIKTPAVNSVQFGRLRIEVTELTEPVGRKLAAPSRQAGGGGDLYIVLIERIWPQVERQSQI